MEDGQDKDKMRDPWKEEAVEEADQIVRRASRGEIAQMSAENLGEQESLRGDFLNWISLQGLNPTETGYNVYEGKYFLKDGRTLDVKWMSGQFELRVESEKEEWDLGLDQETEIRQHMFYLNREVGLPGKDNAAIEYGYSGSTKGSWNFIPGSRSKTEISATKINVFPKMRELKTLLQDARGELIKLNR